MSQTTQFAYWCRSGLVETDECGRVEFSVSRPAEISLLQEWLSSAADVQVSRLPGLPGAGEQGAMDVLTVLAGSSGLVAALRMIPEFMRSRRAGLSITTKIKDQEFTLDATNIKDIMPILERLLDD